MLPLARKQGLLIQHVDRESVVFDQTTNQAHHLSASAALVWRHCDGAHTVQDLAAILRREMDAPGALHLAQLAICELERAGLMERSGLSPAPRLTRRQLARRAGYAASFLPVVASIVAPTPAEATTPVVVRKECCQCYKGTTPIFCVPICANPPTYANCNQYCVEIGKLTSGRCITNQSCSRGGFECEA